jgi:hypothetical protein
MNVSQTVNELFLPFPSALWFNFFVNLISLIVLIRIIKFRNNIDSSYLLSVFILNIIIYFTTSVLHKSELNLGAGFGLFAVFSMLRFRTTDISLQQMTFLFLAIAFGLIAAVWQTNLMGLVAMFSLVLLIIFSIYKILLNKTFYSKSIVYDKIDLIVPDKEVELIKDISNRTGLNILKVEILNIDFLKDATDIKIFYNN